jgi:hypothetical protein
LNVAASGGFTIEGWINPQSVGSQEPIAEWQNGVQFWISVGGSGNLYAEVVDTNGNGHLLNSSPGVVLAGQFQHVALTYDKSSGTGTLYVNSAVVATTNLGSFTPQTSTSLGLGSRQGVINWVGLLDEISVYNVAFTPSQIAAIYNAGTIGKCPSPPFIYVQPTNQTVNVGGTANFSVTVSSSKPVSYHWLLNGTNIYAATNISLVLTNIQASNSGLFSIVVSNSFGSANSSNAVLQVVPYGAPIILVNGQIIYYQTVSANGAAQVTIVGGFPGGITFYTLDGSTPTAGSPIYMGPITVTNTATVQALSLSMDFMLSAEAIPVTVQIVPVYPLQTSVVGGGTVSVTPTNGPYVSNSVVMLTANAAQYWVFDHWQGDAAGNSNPLSATMNSPLNIQAVFVSTAYPLTVGTPGGGGVTANGQVISPATYYPTGSMVNVAATASNGWSFVGWQGTVGGTNNPLNVTMNQTNNIQAIFGTEVGVNAVGGGSVVLSRPNPIPFGTTITAAALPNNGRYFVIWTGAAGGTNTPVFIKVTNATPTVNALFTALPAGKYTLSVIVYGGGTVTVNPQQSYYNFEDTVTLTAATTYAGFLFYGWSQDATGTTNPIAVLVTTNKIVQANFAGYPTGTLLIHKVGQDMQITVTNIYSGHWSVLEGTQHINAGTNTSWNVLSTNTIGLSGTTLLYTDTNTVMLYPQRFYRIYSY